MIHSCIWKGWSPSHYFIECFHHMSLSRRAMNKFPWCQYSNENIHVCFWIVGEKNNNSKTFDAAAFFSAVSIELYWLLNLKLYVVLNVPGNSMKCFVWKLLKFSTSRLWFYWFSPKCQSSAFNPIHSSLAVYRWQTFITANNGNMLQLVRKVGVHRMVIVCMPLISNEIICTNKKPLQIPYSHTKHMHFQILCSLLCAMVFKML